VSRAIVGSGQQRHWPHRRVHTDSPGQRLFRPNDPFGPGAAPGLRLLRRRRSHPERRIGAARVVPRAAAGGRVGHLNPWLVGNEGGSVDWVGRRRCFTNGNGCLRPSRARSSKSRNPEEMRAPPGYPVTIAALLGVLRADLASIAWTSRAARGPRLWERRFDSRHLGRRVGVGSDRRTARLSDGPRCGRAWPHGAEPRPWPGLCCRVDV
jgi:hypothetical protein